MTTTNVNLTTAMGATDTDTAQILFFGNRKGPPLRFPSFFGPRQTQTLRKNPPLKTQTPFFKGGFLKGFFFLKGIP